MTQEVITARQVVEDYKKFNQNTIKQVAKRCPISKAVFYETVKVDENASQFIEKYKKEIKKKKQEKHLGRQLMSAPKPKAEKATTVHGETYKNVLHYVEQGKTPVEIQKLLGLTAATINYHIQSIKKYTELEIKPSVSIRKSSQQYEENKRLFEQGLTFQEIAENRGITLGSIYQSFAKIKRKEGDKWADEVDTAREKNQCVNYIKRTQTIQKLLKQGKSIEEIAVYMKMKPKSVRSNIYLHEKKNGTFKNKSITKTHLQVEKLLQKGLTVNQIADKLNMSYHGVKYNIQKLEKLKP